MSTVILSETAGNGVLTVDGVTALTAKSTGVLEAGAAGVSGNDCAVVSQLPTVGQTIQNLTGSRAKATPYTNDTGKEIWVSVNPTATASATSSLTIDGITVQSIAYGSATVTVPLSAPVPAGSTYQFDSSTTILRWIEKR